MQIELKFTKATKIELVRDGMKIPDEIIPAGGIKQITAQDTVTLTTYDAGSTNITLNGEDIGTLGKTGEKISIPFNKDSAALLKESSE